MSSRSWIALLLLINYLLVVGAGCISRPEDPRGFVQVQTTEAEYAYQDCRYLRMDGLENFLTEALASRYQRAPETAKHHLISVVMGIDAHCLIQTACVLPVPMPGRAVQPIIVWQSPVSAPANRPINAPPWLG